MVPPQMSTFSSFVNSAKGDKSVIGLPQNQTRLRLINSASGDRSEIFPCSVFITSPVCASILLIASNMPPWFTAISSRRVNPASGDRSDTCVRWNQRILRFFRPFKGDKSDMRGVEAPNSSRLINPARGDRSDTCVLSNWRSVRFVRRFRDDKSDTGLPLSQSFLSSVKPIIGERSEI